MGGTWPRRARNQELLKGPLQGPPVVQVSGSLSRGTDAEGKVPTLLPVRKVPDDEGERKVTDEPPPAAARTKVDRRVLLIIVVAVLAIAGVAVLVPMNPRTSGTTTTGSISISSGANTIVTTAVQSDPAGFTLESSKQPSSVSSDWAILQQVSDGSEANVTVVVYSSTNASQAYYDTLVAGLKGLSGYTDVTSSLTSFEQYGTCYGYGEDVDSIAVINGVCTKGNVFLQVHLVSGIAFSSLEGDLTSIMGALYKSAS